MNEVMEYLIIMWLRHPIPQISLIFLHKLTERIPKRCPQPYLGTHTRSPSSNMKLIEKKIDITYDSKQMSSLQQQWCFYRTEQLLAAQGSSPERLGTNGHELALFGQALDNTQSAHLSGVSNNLVSTTLFIIKTSTWPQSYFYGNIKYTFDMTFWNCHLFLRTC